jgi:hypothetical protein
MTLTELIQHPELRITPLTGPFDRPISGGYASDLLSDVLANARPGGLWMTLQTNRNVAAVAGLQELAGVLITSGRQPQEDLLEVARDQRVNVLSTPLSTYEVAGRLYALGVR